MIKRIALILGLGLMASFAFGGSWVWRGTETIKLVHVADGAGDRFIQDTIGLANMQHGSNSVYGRIVFDSTTYDTGAFGNADTVIMVVKSVAGDGDLKRYYTLDSSFKVGAFGLAINDTIDINYDTDTLGSELILIYRFADTLDAGVANTAGDTASMTIRWQIQHKYLD